MISGDLKYNECVPTTKEVDLTSEFYFLPFSVFRSCS